MTEPSKKLYFVKKRTMREGDRKPREIRKLEVPTASKPSRKRPDTHFKYKQRGLTAIGEQRKAIQEERKPELPPPSLPEIIQIQDLKKKNVLPSVEQEKLLQEAKAGVAKKVASSSDPFVKRWEVLNDTFKSAGFPEVPFKIFMKVLALPDPDEAINLFTQMTPAELRTTFKKHLKKPKKVFKPAGNAPQEQEIEEEEEEEPAMAQSPMARSPMAGSPAPAYTREMTNEQFASIFLPMRAPKLLEKLRQLNLPGVKKGASTPTYKKLINDMTPGQLEAVKNEYSTKPYASQEFLKGLNIIIARKKKGIRGHGLSKELKIKK